MLDTTRRGQQRRDTTRAARRHDISRHQAVKQALRDRMLTEALAEVAR